MRRAALLLCLVLTVPLHGAEKWTYASTDLFEVYATGGDRQARDALAYFERVHAFFSDFLKLPPRSGPRTRLIAFSNDRQFAPYSPNQVAAAFYLSTADRDYIVMKSLDERSQPIVVHEYAHQMFRRSGARYPAWLNEGLAEFLATMEPEGNRMGIGRPLESRLVFLTNTAMLPLERLLAVKQSDPEYNTRGHAGVFYSQSWALTHMLLTDTRYRTKWNPFMSLIDSGVAGPQALKIFEKPLGTIELDLYNYVRRSQYTYFLAPYKAPPPLGKLPTRDASPLEADLVTANLLANLPAREAEARTAFERIEKSAPNDVTLLESRAYFEFRRGHRDAALPYFARAAQAGSQSGSLYRDYAILEPSRVEELMAKVVALSPQDTDSRLSYASILLSKRKNAEAVEVLTATTNIPEGSEYRLYRMLASAYMQLDRYVEARTAAARVEEFARTSIESAEAAQLVKTIEDQALRRSLQQQTKPGDPPTLSELLREPPVVVTGRIRNVTCVGKGVTVLEVRTATEILMLLIDNGAAVQVLGRKSTTIDLQCGPQNVPIRIGYVPAINATRKTVGNVRMLDYRQP